MTMDNTTLTVELGNEETTEVEIQLDDTPVKTADDVAKAAEPVVEAVVEEEVQAAPVVEAPVTNGQEQALAELRDQLLHLERRAEQERLRAERAEQDRERVAWEREQAQIDGLMAKGHAIVNAMYAEEADAEGLKRALRDARASGDLDQETEINIKLGKIGARLEKLKEGKDRIDATLKRIPQREAPPKPTPAAAREAAPEPVTRAPADPVEAWISKLTPRSQTYVRSRDKSWVTDQRLNSKLAAADALAVAEGIERDSDAYFNKIDEVMGYKKPEAAPAAAHQPKRAAVPAAPVSHKGASTAGAGNGIKTMKILLSPSEREAARNLGLTEPEYARRKFKKSQPGGHNGLKLSNVT
jgi:hypothetical protein